MQRTAGHCTIFLKVTILMSLVSMKLPSSNDHFSKANIILIANLDPKKLGTAVLLRRGIRAKSTLMEPEGRLISVELDGLNIVCVYAPSGRQLKQNGTSF